MKLKHLIQTLQLSNPEAWVTFDFCGCAPSGEIHSYRGSYENLALGWTDIHTVRAKDLIRKLESCIGTKFEGYKGGEYTMNEDSWVYVDNEGRYTATGIVSVEISDSDFLTIRTEEI